MLHHDEESRKPSRLIYWAALIIMGFTACVMSFLCVVVWKDGRDNAKRVLEEVAYVKDCVSDSQCITDEQKFLRDKKFAILVIGTYQATNYENQIGKYRVAEFIIDMIKWCRWLNFKVSEPLASGTIESGFNPLCIGSIGEVGVFQHTQDCLPEYYLYLRQLAAVLGPVQAQELDAQVTDVAELRDPIKSLKVQLVLMWGTRWAMPDPLYYISAVHWGTHRIRPWYIDKGEPKDYWVFYSKSRLDKVDKRSPLMYYFHWQRFEANFSRYKHECGAEWIDEYRKYRDAANKDERIYLDSRQMVAKLMKTMAKLEQRQQDYTDGLKELDEYRNKLSMLDDECKKLYGETRRDKIDYDTLYERTKRLLKEYAPQLKPR